MDARRRLERGPLRFRTTFRNVIYDVFKAKGWRETESDADWDVAWVDPKWIHEIFDTLHLEDHQLVNHFRNHYELTRKDLLIKNLKRTQRGLQREDRHAEAAQYDFFPQTYVLPADYGLFVEEFKHQPGAFWIMKPIGKAQGKGIFLFSKLSQISDWRSDRRWRGSDRDQQQTPQAESYVVQRYLENPLLIGGKKFDMRIYALVTSFMPMTVRCGFPVADRWGQGGPRAGFRLTAVLVVRRSTSTVTALHASPTPGTRSQRTRSGTTLCTSRTQPSRRRPWVTIRSWASSGPCGTSSCISFPGTAWSLLKSSSQASSRSS